MLQFNSSSLTSSLKTSPCNVACQSGAEIESGSHSQFYCSKVGPKLKEQKDLALTNRPIKKNMLTRRTESDTYLATVSRQITMKIGKM